MATGSEPVRITFHHLADGTIIKEGLPTIITIFPMLVSSTFIKTQLKLLHDRHENL